MKINYVKGYAINQKADTIVNSANGFLLLGTSGAGEIRLLSEKLTASEKIQYNNTLNALPSKVKEWYLKRYKKHGWKPSYAQLSCLNILLKKEGNEFRRGTAVLDEDWSKNDKRRLIHAVAMSYDITGSKSKRKKATPYLIRKALEKTLKIAVSINTRKIAIPVMCARETYGISAEESHKILLSVLKKYSSQIKEAIICLDNAETQRLED